MPRRKKSAPVKWGENSFTGEQNSEGDSSSESGSESDRPQRSDGYEEIEITEKFARWKRKKIYSACPANSVILGEISLSISGSKKIDFEHGTDNLSIIFLTSDDAMGFVIKITHNSKKKHSTFHNAVISNGDVLNRINYLFLNQFFWVILHKEDYNNNEFKISIVTPTGKFPLQKATTLVELFFGEVDKSCMNENQKNPKEHNDVFFKEVQNFQKTDLQLVNKDVQHEILIHKLCSYQVRAVQWMLFRESQNLQEQNTDWLSSLLDKFTTKCNTTIYYNKYSGELYLTLPNLGLLPSGGILADEMGLGKTLSIISLVLSNNRCLEEESDNNDFLLPNEQVGKCQVIIKSGTSLKCDDEVISKNKENSMSAHEKLVYNKASRGPALKRALNEWYASKLAEYSTVTPSKVRKMNNESLKCVCGNVGVEDTEKCVRCPGCERFQHVKCVGFENGSCYFCPACWPKQKLVKSRATLIVAPASIYNQWFDEIKKHVKSEGLKSGVYLYDGLRQGFVQPSVLAKYDIVITTYGILRAEINHVFPNVSSRKLRNEERYLKLCSPLRQIQWWRLCLDEAQMVENDCSQINLMAKMIMSVHRWSVTGTPIQKSVDDLYYLIDWLGVEPFNNKTCWNNLLYRPYLKGNKIPLYSVISKVFWRNSKEDVAGELIIPNQSVKYHLLKFTAIEQNFYMREHALSSTKFSETLVRLGLDVETRVDSLDKYTFGKILTPLLSLRQACSHPLAVKGNRISSKTGNMTLTELLEYLCSKTKVDCDEAVRKHISALNGLAGIYCIQENWSKAVEYYREVLQLCEEYKNKIQIDSLQRIHTLTNLAGVLDGHSEGIPPTLRDESLKEEAKELEDKYMQKSKNELEVAENHLMELSGKISELEKKFESSTQVWWGRLIHLLAIDGSIGELFDKISIELSTNEYESKKKVEQFLYKASSERGLEIVLCNWLSSIEDNREKALSVLDVLKKLPEDKLLSSAIDCHLRQRPSEKRRKCQICACESVMFDYECSLFDISRKVLKREYEKLLDGCETKGSWRAKSTEKCLKVLLNVSKTKNICEPWCLKDGRTHIQLLEAMKKEFKQIRAVWMSINHYVQACDELYMCKLKLRLRLPGESLHNRKSNLSLTETNKCETIHILYDHEVEPQKLKLTAEAELSKSEFRKKYGTLLYLRNLGQKDSPNPDPCPVCKVVLDNEWCVLQCGHSYCIDCIRILLMRNWRAVISCPVCRETTKGADISFIDLNGRQENSDVTVVGDHSTKVEEVVRVLLGLKKSDPNVKVLIFSTWAVVLKILEVALEQNGVSFRRMPGHKYQVHIKEFRDPNSNVTALLLPISWGSKGLNLTEATHVFLVEPIMNPAEELQAIGRVHRIGQTKETVVHRFLICSTIEEKINSAVSEAKDKWGLKKITLKDLQSLFDIQNDYMPVPIDDYDYSDTDSF